MSAQQEEAEDAVRELFDGVDPGVHDGFLVYDLGWAGFAICEALGIENCVACASRGTTAGFKAWVEQRTGASLADWEAVTVTIHERWEEAPLSSWKEEEHYCYRTWSMSAVLGDSAMCRPREVFALRHSAWVHLAEGKVREFFVASQRSYMEALWARDYPGRQLAPVDMDGDAGFVVEGRARGAKSSAVLTWPTSDLAEAISQADSLKQRRCAALVIYQCGGGGYAFTKRNRQAWLRLAEIDKRLGGNNLLIDMARRVRL